MSTTTLDLTSTVNRLLLMADRIERGELLVTTAPAPAPVVIDAPITEAAPALELPVADEPPAMAMPAFDRAAAEPELAAETVLVAEPGPATVSSLPAPPAPPPVDAPAPAPAPVAAVVERPFIPTPPTIIVPAPATRTNDVDVPGTDATALAAIEQLRATIDELSGRKLGPRSRRKLVEALAQEREVLDQLGCDSYLDLMLRKAAGSAQASPLGPPASPSAGISIQTGWLGEDRGIDVPSAAAPGGEIDGGGIEAGEPVDAIEFVPSPTVASARPKSDDAPPTLASFNWPAMAAPMLAPAEDPALANSGA
jgi:hypothetical protein